MLEHWPRAETSDVPHRLRNPLRRQSPNQIWKRQLSAYDASTGELVGQVDVREGFTCTDAAAFTIEGTELAMLGYTPNRRSPTLWCVDWNTGQTTLWANVRAEVEPLQNTYLLGPPLEWFPTNELLLFYGHDVIDRRTGKFCYRIPNNLYWETPRRTLGGRSILGMMPGEDADHRIYRAVPLDSSTFGTALDVVRRGGIAEDIGLPPLTIPVEAAARTIADAPPANPPALRQVERSEFPELTLPMRLVQFREPGIVLRRLEFADTWCMHRISASGSRNIGRHRQGMARSLNSGCRRQRCRPTKYCP